MGQQWGQTPFFFSEHQLEEQAHQAPDHQHQHHGGEQPDQNVVHGLAVGEVALAGTVALHAEERGEHALQDLQQTDAAFDSDLDASIASIFAASMA